MKKTCVGHFKDIQQTKYTGLISHFSIIFYVTLPVRFSFLYLTKYTSIFESRAPKTILFINVMIIEYESCQVLWGIP